MPDLQGILNYSKTPIVILVGLIAAYTLYFSWYTINRHNTLNSYAADLSLIDQPMWNTVRGPGGFMEQTWADRQQPRLAEHFEPILVPLALLFFVGDDVRILLIAQTLALALGALPVYRIARHQLSSVINSASAYPSIPSFAALAFALAYLLFPQLQAANIADFHADPFVVTPLLFAFWYATQRRWGWMWFWAILAMATKETLPTLTAMLGLFLLFDRVHSNSEVQYRQSRFKNGLALFLISTAWFFIATFLVVAPLARAYFGTEGPLYLANRYSGGLTGLIPLLGDPARWSYLLGLFAAVGFLPLLAPELLILGLPVLVANLLSNFPGQYSGEQHYSAPLVVAFVLAAIVGTCRLLRNVSLREVNGQSLRTGVLIGVALWLLTWSFGYHARRGWTPLSVRTETYAAHPAAQQIPALTAQIPPASPISASAAVHPHLAHRRRAYVFPTIAQADYLLVDVTDIPGVHPHDAQTKIIGLLDNDWQLLAASYGLLLAQKSTQPSGTALPDSFFDFARTTTHPSQATPLAFGDGRLQLLGYDLHDDPDDGVTVRLYWQTTAQLPDDLRLWPLISDDFGQLLSDPTQVPQIATVWYPPRAWQPGEVIITETLPQLLPNTFHLGIAAGPAGSFSDPAARLPVKALAHSESAHSAKIEPVSQNAVRANPGRWMQLGTFQRRGPFLTQRPPTQTLQTLTTIDAGFDQTLTLTGFWLATGTVRAGANLPILLNWLAKSSLAVDYTVFIHLIAPDGTRLAQSDAFPTWLTPLPTSQWQPNQPVLDRHTLTIPADLPPGSYSLQVGLYNAQTLDRLSLVAGGDVVTLGQIQIE